MSNPDSASGAPDGDGLREEAIAILQRLGGLVDSERDQRVLGIAESALRRTLDHDLAALARERQR